MFQTSSNKGFCLTFENGNTVSVQWGPGNFCQRKNEPMDAPERVEFWKSNTAVVAAWDERGNHHMFSEYNPIKGSLLPDEVAEFINFVATNKLTTELP